MRRTLDGRVRFPSDGGRGRSPTRGPEAPTSEIGAIVERCRSGDALAWEALVRRFQGRVFSLAFHYLRDVESARDTAQEVFVKVYRKLDAFEGDDFLPWLLRLTRNAALDQLRRRKARPAATTPVGLADALPDASDPARELEVATRCRLVHRALERMTEANREMIVLKEIAGLSFEEIAGLLGIPLGTVKSRSSRARVELASKVVELDPSYATR